MNLRLVTRFGAALTLSAGLAACASSPPAPGPAGEKAALTKPEAPRPHLAEGNGQVVEVPMKGATAVAFRILFYTGSVDDPAGKEGLTALTARLMAEGGTEAMSYPEMLKALYPMAASIDVEVDKEQTVFSGLVHPDHVERFVPMLAEVIQRPRLGEADFARVREDLINDIEKRLKATDDENLGKELLGTMLYPADHPYGHYVGGSVGGLKSITQADVKAHAAKVFGKKRLVIGIGGAVSEGAKAAITGALAELPEGAPRLEILAPGSKPEKNEVLIAEKPAASSAAISIGYPHDARRGHPDFPALGLVQSHFGEHRQFHGVLMKEIRGKRGMNYGDYAYVENFVQEGWSRNARTNVARRQQHFEIWIRPVAKDDTVFALRLALGHLDQLVRGGVSEAEVQNVRQFLLGYTRLWDMTPMRRLGHALDDHFYGVSGWLDTYRSGLEGLDASAVNEAMRRHLVPSPVKIAIVTSDAEALREALLSGRPSEKTYDAEKPEEVLEADRRFGAFPLELEPENVRIVPAEALFR